MHPSKGCVERLTKEYKRLTKEPVPYCTAKPTPSNILEWHFVITGAPKTDYEGGTYHGKILFSPDYPFKPPGILFVTPSGRFTPNAKICFSFSDFHPEAWNPMWHVGTILNGVLSFMNEEATTTGSMSATPAVRKQLATGSMAFNLKSNTFRAMFPEFVETHKAKTAAAQPPSHKSGAPTGDAARQPGGQVQDQRAEAHHEQPNNGAAPMPTYAAQALSILPVVLIGLLAVGVVVFPMFSSR